MNHEGARGESGPAGREVVVPDLTGARLLAKNAALSLLGQGTPLLIALVAVPRLIRGLGLDRFGVLSLTWMLVGYFGLFDFGLSAAVTRLMSMKLLHRRDAEIPALFWTSCALLLALGIVGSLLSGALASVVVERVLKIPSALHPEVLASFYVLAASLPVVTGMAGLSGVLPMGALSFLAPLAVLPFSTSLVAIVGALVAVRFAAWMTLFLLCLRTLPALRHKIQFDRSLVRPLLGFGGWLTVSGVVGPFMVYLDRFLIGAMLSVASVSYYTTPYDLATRLLLLSSPVVAVLFPALAASHAVDRPRTSRLFERGLQVILIALFPFCLILVTLAREGLSLWIGADFARHSSRILELLAVGVFVNGLAQLAMVLAQAIGRPDLPARLHLLELPLYIGGVVWLIRSQGIDGAAIAWVARVMLDAAALFWIAHRLLGTGAGSRVSNPPIIVMALALLVLPMFIQPLMIRSIFLVIVLAAYGVFAWFAVGIPARQAIWARDRGAVVSAR